MPLHPIAIPGYLVSCAGHWKFFHSLSFCHFESGDFSNPLTPFRTARFQDGCEVSRAVLFSAQFRVKFTQSCRCKTGSFLSVRITKIRSPPSPVPIQPRGSKMAALCFAEPVPNDRHLLSAPHPVQSISNHVDPRWRRNVCGTGFQ
jgi:hypothetical protein